MMVVAGVEDEAAGQVLAASKDLNKILYCGTLLLLNLNEKKYCFSWTTSTLNLTAVLLMHLPLPQRNLFEQSTESEISS